jgi:tetratricopeptide (TPR) repeat protein
MPSEKDKESGLSPEISRLSAVLARDPSSKLFMPLAEEYMKAMMVEEAIMTLEDGLKAHPFYMSARVLLGKAYMEKNNQDEALVQFELVVKTIPDNLLAHRMLGSIYKSLGRYPEAIRSFRMISILNPKDEEAKLALEELESGKASPEKTAPEEKTEFKLDSHRAEPQQVPGQTHEQPPQNIEAPVFDMSETEAQPTIEEGVLELPAFMDETSEVPASEEEKGNAILEMPLLDMDTIGTLKSEPETETETTAAFAGDDFLQEPRPDEDLSWDGELTSEPLYEEPAVAAGSGYAVDFKATGGLEDIFSAYDGGQENDDTPSENKAGVYEITEEISSFDAEVFKPEQQETTAYANEVKPDEATAEPFETETLAELYIAQGFYDRAIGIYKNLLVEDPGNNQVRQKLEDLYLLAGLSSSKAAVDAEKESAAAPGPAPFTGFDEEPAGIWDVTTEEMPEQSGHGVEILPDTYAMHEELTGSVEEQTAEEAQSVKMPAQVDMAATRRLEQFLTNIRKKAGR